MLVHDVQLRRDGSGDRRVVTGGTDYGVSSSAEHVVLNHPRLVLNSECRQCGERPQFSVSRPQSDRKAPCIERIGGDVTSAFSDLVHAHSDGLWVETQAGAGLGIHLDVCGEMAAQTRTRDGVPVRNGPQRCAYSDLLLNRKPVGMAAGDARPSRCASLVSLDLGVHRRSPRVV